MTGKRCRKRNQLANWPPRQCNHGDVHGFARIAYKLATLASRNYYLFTILAGVLSLLFFRRFPLSTRSPVGLNFRQLLYTMSTAGSGTITRPKTQAEWQQALEDLPSNSHKIPAFFFGHGSPMLVMPEGTSGRVASVIKHAGPNGPLAKFLKDFGPALLAKYKPRAIVVFSAHWDTFDEILGVHTRLVDSYSCQH